MKIYKVNTMFVSAKKYNQLIMDIILLKCKQDKKYVITYIPTKKFISYRKYLLGVKLYYLLNRAIDREELFIRNYKEKYNIIFINEKK